MKRFCIWNRRQVSVVLGLLFAGAILLVALAAAIPYAYANATADSARRLPIYCTDRADKVASLSFDAVWSDTDTQQLIDILGQYGVKATFFVTGDWVDRCTDSVRALHRAGHEIMNLSDTHPNMPTLPREKMLAELRSCGEKIQAVTGIWPSLCRAPYGDFDNTLIETAEGMGLRCIQWDVDSLDARDLPAADITSRVVGQVSSGSIVRFHNAAKHTPEALPDILSQLQAQGYTFLPVSEMIYNDHYTVNHEGRQIRTE